MLYMSVEDFQSNTKWKWLPKQNVEKNITACVLTND